MWCDAGPLRLSKIHGRVLTTLFNAIVRFPKGIELSISFVVRGKVTKQPFHHFDKNVFSLLQMIRPLVRWLGTLHQKRPITLKGIFLSRVPTEIIERNCDWACRGEYVRFLIQLRRKIWFQMLTIWSYYLLHRQIDRVQSGAYFNVGDVFVYTLALCSVPIFKKKTLYGDFWEKLPKFSLQ